MPDIANKVKQILSNLYQKVKQFYAKLKPQSREARTVLEMKDALSKMQDLFVEGINAATENLRNMKNTATEGDAKLQARDGGENNSIKGFIRNVTPELEKMDPVTRIERDSFQHNRKSEIAKEIEAEFKRFGNKVERKNFGVVLLEFKQINKALNYLDTDAEKNSLYAVPNVIKRGIIAESHLQHKERNVDSFTFAAPIEINGKRGNMGVVVQRVQGTNRYKTHRIIMPDGSVFVFENKKQRRKPIAVFLIQKEAYPFALFLIILYTKQIKISILLQKKSIPRRRLPLRSRERRYDAQRLQG